MLVSTGGSVALINQAYFLILEQELNATDGSIGTRTKERARGMRINNTKVSFLKVISVKLLQQN